MGSGGLVGGWIQRIRKSRGHSGASRIVWYGEALPGPERDMRICEPEKGSARKVSSPRLKVRLGIAWRKVGNGVPPASGICRILAAAMRCAGLVASVEL